MSSTAAARLSEAERTLLDRYVEELASRFGKELHAVWLFGSRARGEDTGTDSDVDLLVLIEDDSWPCKERIRALVHDTARELELDEAAWSYSVHIHTPEWLRRRREIESFFIGEVDRDKIVLVGGP